MIPQQNLDLWKRIQQFEMDIPNVAFPFQKGLHGKMVGRMAML